MLSDRSIITYIDKKSFSVGALGDGMLQPNSIDMRLDNNFRIFNNHKYSAIDVTDVPDDLTQEVHIKEGGTFVLHPGELVLASTVETINLGPSFAGLFLGKSSLARVGLIVESAGLCDAGFSGQITLELANINNIPLILRPGIKIGQLCLFKLDSPSMHPYGDESLHSHYQGQKGPTPSRLHTTLQNWMNNHE